MVVIISGCDCIQKDNKDTGISFIYIVHILHPRTPYFVFLHRFYRLGGSMIGGASKYSISQFENETKI